ncbi:MAG: DUF6034 family protein [Candidatus Woesearchaeota archaeon]
MKKIISIILSFLIILTIITACTKKVENNIVEKESQKEIETQKNTLQDNTEIVEEQIIDENEEVEIGEMI